MKRREFVFIFGIVAVSAVALIAMLTGCTPQEETTTYGAADSLSRWIVAMENPDPVVELKDVRIPDGMREEGLGLFWMTLNSNGSENYLKSTTEAGKNAFDPEKPVMLFFHGMQFGTGATEDEGYHFANYWIDAGYNVGIFNWSQLADGLPMNIEGKVWGAEKIANGEKQNIMDWTGGGFTTGKENPNVSVAEIFVAYYMDFMKNVDYRGSEIRFTGLSLGGQMALATSSYLVAKEIQGLLDAKYIPDRVALFDPYIMQSTVLGSNVYVPWLKRDMFLPTDKADFPTTTGAELMGDIVVMLRNRGIALEYVPSVSGVVPQLLSGYDDGAKKQFYQNCATLDLRTDYATNPLTEFNGFHLAGREWYAKTLKIDVMDTAMENSSEYAVGALTPTPYIYLRSGVTYRMNENWNVNPYEDVIYSINIENAQVGGFAYVDANDDGIYNDRIQNRLAGVKVELYLINGTKTEMIASAVTDHTGAYLLNVEDINANGFSKFYLKVYAPKGYQIAKTAGATEQMDAILINAVNTEGQSEEFTLAHTKALKVLNLGFKK